MARTGSANSFVKHLGRSDRISQSLNTTALRVRQSKELQMAATDMGYALKAGDFEELLAMEKLAVQRDFKEFETDLAQKSESGHRQILERWRMGCDPQKAREDFQASYAPENLPKARVMDTVMESLIKTQCRRLADYAKGNTSPAEQLYFSRRQEALKAVYKEHMLHLSQALGHDKVQERGKSKALSR